MTAVLNVASYILQQQGQMTPMKLQKLVYYAQVWWSVAHDAPLFPDPVKAWARGPVVPSLFQEHKGRATIEASELAGDAAALSPEQRALVDEVLGFYGALPAAYLSKLTHHERPWRDARARGAAQGHESPTIALDDLRAFYRGRTFAELHADYKLAVARELMDRHHETLARLAQ